MFNFINQVNKTPPVHFVHAFSPGTMSPNRSVTDWSKESCMFIYEICSCKQNIFYYFNKQIRIAKKLQYH